jgi:tRNA splicing ligase
MRVLFKKKCKRIRVKVYEAIVVQFRNITWKGEKQSSNLMVIALSRRDFSVSVVDSGNHYKYRKGREEENLMNNFAFTNFLK